MKYFVFEREILDGDEVNNDSTSFEAAQDAFNFLAQRVGTLEVEGFVDVAPLDTDEKHEDIQEDDIPIVRIEMWKGDDEGFYFELVKRSDD